jgi:hypothetical protein
MLVSTQYRVSNTRLLTESFMNGIFTGEIGYAI